MQIALRRLDPARNMARFYVVAVGPTLFGDLAVVRHWGRIGKRGSYRLDFVASKDEAIAVAARIVGAKIRRGYR